MKRSLILILLVLAGCREQTLTETLNSTINNKTITDRQAETLSRVRNVSLNSLTSITDQQAESLSKVQILQLNSLTTITDQLAESLSKVEGSLHLNGLTTITDQQAESLSKVEYLHISEALQPLIDKYKKR